MPSNVEGIDNPWAFLSVFAIVVGMVMLGVLKSRADKAEQMAAEGAKKVGADIQRAVDLAPTVETLTKAYRELTAQVEQLREELASFKTRYQYSLDGLRAYRAKAPNVRVELHPDVENDLQ